MISFAEDFPNSPSASSPIRYFSQPRGRVNEAQEAKDAQILTKYTDLMGAANKLDMESNKYQELIQKLKYNKFDPITLDF